MKTFTLSVAMAIGVLAASSRGLHRPSGWYSTPPILVKI